MAMTKRVALTQTGEGILTRDILADARPEDVAPTRRGEWLKMNAWLR